MAGQLRNERDEQPQGAVVQQPDDGENDMYLQAQDDPHFQFGNGNVDKGPTIEEPAALTRVVDAAVAMVRAYEHRTDTLRDVVEMVESYFVGQNMDHYENDEKFRIGLFKPIRELLISTDLYFNSVLHDDTEIHSSINTILRQFSHKVREVIGGCAVAVVEFTSLWVFYLPYPKLFHMCYEVREMLLKKVLTKEKIKAALAELKDPLSDEASLQVAEILHQIKEKFLRVQVSFQSKSLLSCLRGKSSTWELTFMAAFPSKAKDEKKELELMKKFVKQFEDFPDDYYRLYHTIRWSFLKKKLTQSEDSKISFEDIMKEIPDPGTIRQRYDQRRLKRKELEEGSKVYKHKGKKELKGETEEEELVELFKDTELGERKEKENKGDKMGTLSSQEEQAAGEQSK
ncbi:uncharacterized protein [Watersipora subatra]|uniref:uncharacterized protein n=1 Tax=Watersipora subatra TaxID=2589382 RepID=UPI00355C979E